jgi:hypothetical protein
MFVFVGSPVEHRQRVHLWRPRARLQRLQITSDCLSFGVNEALDHTIPPLQAPRPTGRIQIAG